MWGYNKRLSILHDQIHGGWYRAKASKRIWIPKSDGRQRPIGIAALEDKIVQQALVEILQVIYEEDFLGFTHICSTCRMKGKFKLLRKTISKRLRGKIKEVCQILQLHRHKPVVEQGKWLRSVVL